MNPRRLFRFGQASLALTAPFAQAATPVTSVVGDQNYYNVRACVEACGVLNDAPYTFDGKLCLDTKTLIDTSLGGAFNRVPDERSI